jgi:hypothetical protein
MSNEEEDTCMLMVAMTSLSYEEEDTCHMRRRMHVRGND